MIDNEIGSIEIAGKILELMNATKRALEDIRSQVLRPVATIAVREVLDQKDEQEGILARMRRQVAELERVDLCMNFFPLNDETLDAIAWGLAEGEKFSWRGTNVEVVEVSYQVASGGKITFKRFALEIIATSDLSGEFEHVVIVDGEIKARETSIRRLRPNVEEVSPFPAINFHRPLGLTHPPLYAIDAQGGSVSQVPIAIEENGEASPLPRREMRECPDCGAMPGTIHSPNCDVQRCSVCGMQFLQCGCEGHDSHFARWSGFWPGGLEADRMGIDMNRFYELGLHEVFFVKPDRRAITHDSRD